MHLLQKHVIGSSFLAMNTPIRFLWGLRDTLAQALQFFQKEPFPKQTEGNEAASEKSLGLISIKSFLIFFLNLGTCFIFLVEEFIILDTEKKYVLYFLMYGYYIRSLSYISSCYTRSGSFRMPQVIDAESS